MVWWLQGTLAGGRAGGGGGGCSVQQSVAAPPSTTSTAVTQTPAVSSPDMADREDKVYKAKLAEQAERYDGE